MSKVYTYANKHMHLVLTRCKSKSFACGVNFTHVSKCVHMHRFAYVSKFAYVQINTRVCKSVHVYTGIQAKVLIIIWFDNIIFRYLLL